MTLGKTHCGCCEFAFEEIDGYLNIVIRQFPECFLKVLPVIRFGVKKGYVDFFLHCSLLLYKI